MLKNIFIASAGLLVTTLAQADIIRSTTLLSYEQVVHSRHTLDISPAKRNYDVYAVTNVSNWTWGDTVARVQVEDLFQLYPNSLPSTNRNHTYTTYKLIARADVNLPFLSDENGKGLNWWIETFNPNNSIISENEFYSGLSYDLVQSNKAKLTVRGGYALLRLNQWVYADTPAWKADNQDNSLGGFEGMKVLNFSGHYVTNIGEQPVILQAQGYYFFGISDKTQRKWGFIDDYTDFASLGALFPVTKHINLGLFAEHRYNSGGYSKGDWLRFVLGYKF